MAHKLWEPLRQVLRLPIFVIHGIGRLVNPPRRRA
jgi:hypothetical protein